VGVKIGKEMEMSNVMMSRAVRDLQWVHSVTEKLTIDWPDAMSLHQNKPTDNHLWWTMGHLASTYDWFRHLLDGKPMTMPESFSVFGYGSKPQPSADGYPSLTEVRAHFARTFTEFCKVAGSMSDADGAKPCESDPHGLANDKLEAINRAIWHDGWHSGQLGALRKSLGLPSVIG